MTASPKSETSIGIEISAELVRPRIRKQLFGGHYLRFADVAGIQGFMHHNGLLLAQAMPTQRLDLMYLFGDSIDEEGLSGMFRRLAQERLDSYREVMENEPDSSMQLVVTTEYAKIGVPFQPSTSTKKLENAAKMKVPIEMIGDLMSRMIGEGIEFGFCQPELGRKMLEAPERINQSDLSEARQYGLAVPPQIDVVRLEDQIKTLLEMVTKFAIQHRPDLVARLGLRTI